MWHWPTLSESAEKLARGQAMYMRVKLFWIVIVILSFCQLSTWHWNFDTAGLQTWSHWFWTRGQNQTKCCDQSTNCAGKTLKEFESAKCDDLSFEMISCWSLVPMLIHCSVSNSLNIGWWPTGCFVRLHGGWLSGRASSTAIRIWRNAVRSLYENLDRWSWQLLAPTSLFCLQYYEEQEGYGLWDSEFQFRFVFVIHCDPVFICDVHLLYRSVWRLRDLRNHGLAQTQWDLGSSTGAESNSQQQEALVSIIVR